MRLAHVEIQAYRSIYDVKLVPAAFKVLVGPNNAGKTNLADALEFLGQVARNGLEVAVSREGGFENLAFRRAKRTRKPVRFALTANVDAADITHRFYRTSREVENYQIQVEYSFELRASSESRDADFRVTSEDLRMQISGTFGKASVTVRRRESKVEIETDVHALGISDDGEAGKAIDEEIDLLLDPFSVRQFSDYLETSLEPTGLVLNRAGINPVIREVLNDLGRTRVFQLTPVECRLAGAVTPNPELERHGGNLPAVIRYMQRNHKGAWNATLEAMRGIMPGLTSIEPQFTTDRRLALLFHERGARPWTSNEVSDGTIQSLALFTCLFDPRLPLTMIEEPENSIHPWIVKMFVDACRATQGKQVLVTSHSPALVSYLRPQELDVVWRDDKGRTRLCPLAELDPQAPGMWERGELDLYELIDGGWIRESVPPGLQ